MNAADLTFGIEIETTMPASYRPYVGGYHGFTPAHGLPTGWSATRDCSIHAGRGRTACEFVSPVLRGAEGLRSIVAAVDAIVAMGGRVNRTCGLHVHVGFDRQNEAAIKRLVTLTANVEKAIYASTGTRAREGGRWSRPVRDYGNAENAVRSGAYERYRLLNLSNLTTGRKPTVEFRAFAGTLNPVKILGHVRMALGLVERAVNGKRITRWTGKPRNGETFGGSIRRNGDGQTALARTFYLLGWTKGRLNHTYGWIDADGCPDLKATKRKMMEMAKKYDGVAA